MAYIISAVYNTFLHELPDAGPRYIDLPAVQNYSNRNPNDHQSNCYIAQLLYHRHMIRDVQNQNLTPYPRPAGSHFPRTNSGSAA